jgi:hypothetical protein
VPCFLLLFLLVHVPCPANRLRLPPLLRRHRRCWATASAALLPRASCRCYFAMLPPLPNNHTVNVRSTLWFDYLSIRHPASLATLLVLNALLQTKITM